MRSVFYPHLVNGPFGDPALYVRIAHRGQALLFDCGELQALSPRELLKLHAVFVTHAHIDHLIGFDHLLRTFLYLDRQLYIYGPAGLIDQISHRLAGYTWNLIAGYHFVLTVREWVAGEVRECSFHAENRFAPGPLSSWPSVDGCLIATPDWTVRVESLSHGSINSLAFSLEETLHVAIHKDALIAHGYQPGSWLTQFKGLVRRAEPDCHELEVPLVQGGLKVVSLGVLKQTISHCEAGMKVVYVADAAPTTENIQKIITLARNANLLVIEAAFAHADLDRARQRHHLTARLSGELGREAGAARLLVFHHSPRYQRTPDLLRKESVAAFTGE
ncbi:MAG: MBL fold metallo-hydrolase [Desulfuromonadales bacterium]